MLHELLTVSKVAQLAGCSEGSIRKEADAGRLPVAVKKSDNERLFTPTEALRFSVNRRFGLNLQRVDAAGAAALGAAIAKSSGPVVAEAYPLLCAFASMLDDAGRLEIATAVRKLTPASSLGFEAPVEKLMTGGNLRK